MNQVTIITRYDDVNGVADVFKSRAAEFGIIAGNITTLLGAAGEIWQGDTADHFFNISEKGFIEIRDCERLTLEVEKNLRGASGLYQETDNLAVAKLREVR